jgi:hypothetical protein
MTTTTNYTYISRMESQGFKVIVKDIVKSYKEYCILIDLANKYENVIVIIKDSKLIQCILEGKISKYIPGMLYIIHKYNVKIALDNGIEKVNNFKLFFKPEYLECIICYTDNKKGSIVCKECSSVVCLDCINKIDNCPVCRLKYIFK